MRYWSVLENFTVGDNLTSQKLVFFFVNDGLVYNFSRLAGSLMRRFMMMVQSKDMALYLKLQEQDMKPQFFAFRWLTLMLSQEFQLPGELSSAYDEYFHTVAKFALM